VAADSAEIARIFLHAPIGIVHSEHRVIRTCNLTFAAMFGYHPEELAGRSFEILYPSRREFEQIRDVGIPALSIGRPYSDERLMARRDGSAFWCRVRASTLTPHEPLASVILSFAEMSAPPPSQILSARERQVVSGLHRGRTSKEIALELGLSHRTIEDIRSRLLKKTGARNTTELLSRFVGV